MKSGQSNSVLGSLQRVAPLLMALLLVCSVAIVANAAHAAPPGDLDTSFGVAGKKFLNWDHESRTRPAQVLLDTSGRSVTFMTINSTAGIPKSTMIRRLSTGVIDTSFGTNGRSIDIPESFNYGGLLLADGKILMLVALQDISVGSSSEMKLMRYSADGVIDTSFGNSGSISISSGSGRWWLDNVADIQNGKSETTTAHAVVRVQSNGRIIVANTSYDGWIGNWSDGRTELHGFTANGTVDTSFGTNGSTQIFEGSGNFTAFADLAIDANDKMFLVTTHYVPGTSSVWLYRLLANGTQDQNFHGDSGVLNGRSELLIGLTRIAGSVTILSSTRILVTAMSGGNYSVAKFDYAGISDNTFGTQGVITYAPSGMPTSPPFATVVQPDGKIVLGYGLDFKPYVVRLTSAGALDGTFGSARQLGDNGYVSSIVRQANGNLVVARTEISTSQTHIDSERTVLNRVLGASGALDGTWGSSGTITFTTNELQGYNEDSQVITNSMGEIFVVSEWRPLYRFSGEDYDLIEIAIYKVNGSGSLDTSFGSNGIQTYYTKLWNWNLENVVIGSNDELIMDFNSRINGSNSQIEVMRLQSDGTLDLNFLSTQAMDAISVSLSLGVDYWEAGIAYGGPNHLYLIGNSGPEAYVYRILDDGTLDVSFDGDAGNGNGRVRINFDSNDEGLDAISVDPQGRVLIAGNLLQNEFLLRLLSDGKLDQSFNGSGVKSFSMLGMVPAVDWQMARFISVNPVTQKILIASDIYSSSQGVARNSLVQLNNDGSFDVSFDGDAGNGNGRVLIDAPGTISESYVLSLTRDTGGVVLGIQRSWGMYVMSVSNTGNLREDYIVGGISHPNIDGWMRSFTFVDTVFSNGFWMGAAQKNFDDGSVGDFLFKFNFALQQATTTSSSSSTTSSSSSTTSSSSSSSTTSTSTSTSSTTTTLAPPATTPQNQQSETTTSAPSPVTTLPPLITQITIAVRVQPTLSKKTKASFAAIAKYAGLTVGKKDVLSIAIATSSAKVCAKSGAALKGLKTGSCSVTVKVVFVATKKSKSAKVKLKVT